MDHFGIGQAMLGMAQVYFRSSKDTGRSTSLLESVKDGDRIIVVSEREGHRLRQLLRELGKNKVGIVAINPQHPEKLFSDMGTAEGRTIFDHSWVEQYYLNAIETAARDIDHFQRESSGFGMAHIETRLAAREISKWRV